MPAPEDDRKPSTPTVPAGLASGSAPGIAVNLTKVDRIAMIKDSIAAAESIAVEADARMDSPDGVQASRARRIAIDARNKRDDLNEVLIFLTNKDVLKPIPADDIRRLDELGDEIDGRIHAGALVSATLKILTVTLNSVASIGQILDERV
ncbi:MAG: hypothetical protein ABJF23_04850 [Bryobacteraceae bacterium]